MDEQQLKKILRDISTPSLWEIGQKIDNLERRLNYIEQRINVVAHGVSFLVAVAVGALIFWLLRPWPLAWIAALIAAGAAGWGYIDRPMKNIDKSKSKLEEDEL